MENNVKLTYEKKNIWLDDNYSNGDIFAFAEKYKTFLNNGKTERECVAYAIDKLEANGFVNINSISSDKLTAGDKVYKNISNKAICFAVIGKETVESGFNTIVSHVDAPRLDFKVNPLYEKTKLALIDTHYYGGIKKYQWVGTPLAIHGVVFRNDGSKVEISIGEDENDPIFTITDLLPHLSSEIMVKKANELFTGEELDALVGSIPLENAESQPVKKYVLSLLNEKYGITERDFNTAELEFVPAGLCRDLGFDRGLLSGYGHDDRCCSFASLEGILEIDAPNKTAIGIWFDKEEIGSYGATGAESLIFDTFTAQLIKLITGKYDTISHRICLENTNILSADVNAAIDPNFEHMHDDKNASNLGYGVVVEKYTGARGKSGANDANAEYLSYITRLFNNDSIIWQTGQLGKVDKGGGGTVAAMLAKYGCNVVDCGIPVLCMHAPYEIISKADLYMTYRAYKTFYNG